MFNKTAKKLFVSSLTLVFAAATAISSTYAWFTTQTTAKVSQIDINVTTGEGFEIRFGGKGLIGEGVETPVPYTDSDYKQTLTMTDFNKAYPGVLDGLKLDHITLQAVGLDAEDEESKVSGEKVYILMEDGEEITGLKYVENTDGTGYLKFDIFFRGRGAYNIYFTSSNTYGWSEGRSMPVPSIFLNAEGTMSAYTEGSTHYSTIPNGESGSKFVEREKDTVASGNNLFAYAIDAARMSVRNTTFADVYEDTEDEEKVTDIKFEYEEPKILKFTNGGYGEAAATVGSGDPITYTHRNYAFDYYKHIKGLDEVEFADINNGNSEDITVQDPNEVYFLNKAVLPSSIAYSAGDERKPLLKLADGYNPSVSSPVVADTDLTDLVGNNVFYGSLEVRIWLEGWDADCFNAIFGDILKINLGFESATD